MRASDPPSSPDSGTASPADESGAASPAGTLTRAPQQARSRRTLQRIRTAAWALLGEGGPDALTVTGVATRARISVGSFYARFEGKDELLDHLSAVALEEALSSWDALEGEVPPGADSHAGALRGGGYPGPSARAGTAGPAGGKSRSPAQLLPDETSSSRASTASAPTSGASLLHRLDALISLYHGGAGGRLHALSRMDPRAQARLGRLQEQVARSLAPHLAPFMARQGGEGARPGAPGAGHPRTLLGAAALAAAGRELALALDDPERGWLFSPAADPSEKGGAPAGVADPGSLASGAPIPRARILATLARVAGLPAGLVPEGGQEGGPEADHAPSDREAPAAPDAPVDEPESVDEPKSVDEPAASEDAMAPDPPDASPAQSPDALDTREEPAPEARDASPGQSRGDPDTREDQETRDVPVEIFDVWG